jgi:hypothetical protein
MSGTYGTFKFLSTEKNGSGRTKEYTVSYYYVPTIAAGQCVYLKSDGTTETVTPSVSSGVINLTPGEISNPNQTIVGCYFGDMSNVTTIGDYFLGYCYVLRTVDLTSFSNVTNIGNQFL